MLNYWFSMPNNIKIALASVWLLTIILGICYFLNKQDGSLLRGFTGFGSSGAIADVDYEKARHVKGAFQYVSGDKILNENGSEVMWRGAGGSYLFHAGDGYREAWERHLPEIKAMGLNTIRLAFAFADSTPNPDYGVPSADIFDF